jgi:aldehyde reductase
MSTSIQNLIIPTVKLTNGNSMPLLGFGTSRTATDSTELEKALKYAIKLGYRMIDTAWIYANESIIAKAIKEVMAEVGGDKIKREDLFITSKVWNTFHAKEATKGCVNRCLNNLDLRYGDLFLIHWPMALKENEGQEPFPRDNQGNLIFSNVDFIETYRALEECVDSGLCKSIGLSNFNIEQCERVLRECRIKPVCNQIEVHPYMQNEELVKFCQNNGMIVQAYSPLGATDLTEMTTNVPNLLEDEVLNKIAQKHNKSVAQVCLKWSLTRGCVPIVKTLNLEKILENAQIFDFELTPDEIQDIRKLDKNLRIYDAAEFKNHPQYPFKQ